MSDLVFDANLHKFYHGGNLWPSVTQVIRAAGLSPFNGVPERFLEEGRIRGKAIARACEFVDKGISFAWPSEWAEREYGGFVAGYGKFQIDFDYKPLLTEHKVHDHGREYAGILDSFGTADYRLLPHKLKPLVTAVDGRCFLLLDWKTGELDASMGLQLAAYLRALEYGGLPEPRDRFVLRISLKLNADSTYDVPVPYMSPLDDRVFLSALTVTNWKGVNL